AQEPDERRDDEDKRSLREQVADNIAHSLIWRAVLDFGSPSVSRSQLLTRFETVLKCYPADEKSKPAPGAKPRSVRADYQADAQEYAALLKRMIEEDETHAKRPVKPEKGMTKQRVADLIFQLRDQNGQQFSQPGACDIFLDP